VATGGFGRGWLFPHSDIDLLFLHANGNSESEFKDSIRRFSQELWDLRLKLSPATRNLAECERLDPNNVEFAISLLDCRYLAGDRDLTCSPWTTVTRNPQGWKGPCYLITNGHYKTFEELHAATDWEYYRTKQDFRCKECKLHSGFEGTAALEFGKNLKDSWRMVRHYVA